VRIGELAKIVGVSPKTIRYWEEIGLLPPPPRNPSGYRDYGEEYVHLCKFILRAKVLGFKLAEIREILNLRLSGKEPCECVRGKIKAKIEEIDRLVEVLLTRRRVLRSLLEGERRETAPVCPILESDIELKDEPAGLFVPYGEEIPGSRKSEEYDQGPGQAV
jgi:DNA-binding transcriptional MerR regulator